jgi:photosystem II protein PsbQ
MASARIPAVFTAFSRTALSQQLRRLLVLCLATVLCLGLSACDGSQGKKPPSISPDDMALIERQA